MGKNESANRGYERILQLIEWLSEQVQPATLADVVQATGWPKSSTLLLLRSLVDGGYVSRTQSTRYQLVRLPGEPSAQNTAWGTLIRISEPVLRSVVDSVEETGFLAVLTPDMRLRYLNKLLPAREIRYDRDIASTRVPHYVASGLMLLAGMTDTELQSYLQQVAAKSNDDIEQIHARVLACRKDGYAVNLQGRVEGAAGVSAPIYDRSGHFIAAVNISGPRDRIAENLEQVIAGALEAARQISEILAVRISRS